MNLVWLRSDLRTIDNPALHAASQGDQPVIALFLICAEQWRDHDWGDARVGFLLETLKVCQQDLEARGIPLILRHASWFSEAPEVVRQVVDQFAVQTVHANAEYEWNERQRDRAVKQQLQKQSVAFNCYHDQCLVPPGDLLTGQGKPYQIFTPFKKAWINLVQEQGLPARALSAPRKRSLLFAGDTVPDSVKRFGQPDCLAKWAAGEQVARKLAQQFCKGPIADYADARDVPARTGTSCLSPYLAIGSISPASCLRLALAANQGAFNGSGAGVWISELVWREFYRHILVMYPHVSRGRAFKVDTEAVHWREDIAQELAWQQGKTGIPIVDAGMRQLLATGWMHNRVRMIVAMFFSKSLLLDWRRGERFFARHLIDIDLAANNGGWQWSASTGTDSAPYFRVFNPLSQSKKHDPEGIYIKTWVPELIDVPAKALHAPEHMPQGVDYPRPIVDLKETRKAAIAAFADLKAD